MTRRLFHLLPVVAVVLSITLVPAVQSVQAWYYLPWYHFHDYTAAIALVGLDPNQSSFTATLRLYNPDNGTQQYAEDVTVSYGRTTIFWVPGKLATLGADKPNQWLGVAKIEASYPFQASVHYRAEGGDFAGAGYRVPVGPVSFNSSAYTFKGYDYDDELYAPLVWNNHYGIVSRFILASAFDTAVTIYLYRQDSGYVGQEDTDARLTVSLNAYRPQVVYLHQNSAQDATRLDASLYSARLVSSNGNPIVALIQTAWRTGDRHYFWDYPAVARYDLSQDEVWYPWLDMAGTHSTGIVVLNPTTNTLSNVQIKVCWENDTCEAPIGRSLAPREAWIYTPPDRGMLGFAVAWNANHDGGLVGIANVYDGGGGKDFAYAGINVPWNMRDYQPTNLSGVGPFWDGKDNRNSRVSTVANHWYGTSSSTLRTQFRWNGSSTEVTKGIPAQSHRMKAVDAADISTTNADWLGVISRMDDNHPAYSVVRTTLDSKTLGLMADSDWFGIEGAPLQDESGPWVGLAPFVPSHWDDDYDLNALGGHRGRFGIMGAVGNLSGLDYWPGVGNTYFEDYDPNIATVNTYSTSYLNLDEAKYPNQPWVAFSEDAEFVYILTSDWYQTNRTDNGIERWGGFSPTRGGSLSIDDFIPGTILATDWVTRTNNTSADTDVCGKGALRDDADIYTDYTPYTTVSGTTVDINGNTKTVTVEIPYGADIDNYEKKVKLVNFEIWNPPSWKGMSDPDGVFAKWLKEHPGKIYLIGAEMPGITFGARTDGWKDYADIYKAYYDFIKKYDPTARLLVSGAVYNDGSDSSMSELEKGTACWLYSFLRHWSGPTANGDLGYGDVPAIGYFYDAGGGAYTVDNPTDCIPNDSRANILAGLQNNYLGEKGYMVGTPSNNMQKLKFVRNGALIEEKSTGTDFLSKYLAQGWDIYANAHMHVYGYSRTCLVDPNYDDMARAVGQFTNWFDGRVNVGDPFAMFGSLTWVRGWNDDHATYDERQGYYTLFTEYKTGGGLNSDTKDCWRKAAVDYQAVGDTDACAN